MKIRFVFLCFISLYFLNGVLGQNPSIDSIAFKNWPYIMQSGISDNGKFCAYTVEYRQKKQSELIIKAIINGDSTRFENVSSFQFTNDSRRILFNKGGDSLGILNLESGNCIYINKVELFSIPGNSKAGVFAYITGGRLVVDNGGGEERTFDNVEHYTFSDDGKILLVQCSLRNDTVGSEALIWVNLNSWEKRTIWRGSKIGKYCLNEYNYRLAFMATDSGMRTGEYSIYWYCPNMRLASVLVKDIHSLCGNVAYNEDMNVWMDKSGDRILVKLTGMYNSGKKYKERGKNVVVWNYHDPYLQTSVFKDVSEYDSKGLFWTVIDINSRKENLVGFKKEKVINNEMFSNYILLYSFDSLKRYQPDGGLFSIYLVSAIDGSRRFITRIKSLRYISLSPDEKYILWFDPARLCYSSYETATGVVRNISNLISTFLYDTSVYKRKIYYPPYGAPRWDGAGHTIFLFDEFDIWKVDLGGKALPVNITNGYGRNHQIIFDLVENNEALPFSVVDGGNKMLLTGFDPGSKQNGFWWTRQAGDDPEKGNMEDYCYLISRTNSIEFDDKALGFTPLKAKWAEKYLVMRKNASEFPRLFVTDDFRTFVPISNIHPEKGYNWIRPELLSWNMADGSIDQGILYRPENFDSSKKYPLIFNIYERKSNMLNEYLYPSFTFSAINIPFFVSNGYLVFTPDIHYTIGAKGLGVLNSVESALNYLKRFSWIDTSRLGIQGHSFGGWEVDFLVTHLNKFAAACASSGVSDEVSYYDAISGGFDRQGFYETGGQGSPYGRGVTPWSNPGLYIENSPIFSVEKANTPLLISHGELDGSVLFSQGMEMYMAMRRAYKKVWLLQYRQANHVLGVDDAKDFTIRLKQFFDYYLKGMPPPIWMTNGIPEYLQGIDSGYELDTSGTIP